MGDGIIIIQPTSKDSSGSSTDLPAPDLATLAPTSIPTPPSTLSPSGASRKRTDTHFQMIGLDGSLAPEGTWLSLYDSAIGVRGLFFGPEEASAGNLRLNLHWQAKGLDLFNSFNYTNSTTAGLPSGVSIHRFDAEMGFANYRDYRPLLGKRGEGGYLGLGGVKYAGLGFGLVLLTGGVADQGHSPMIQIRPLSYGDHLTMGYGPFELGIRFFESNTAITLGSGAPIQHCEGLHCNESDFIPNSSLRGPVFSLRYYINPPSMPDTPPARLGNDEFAFRLTDLNMSRFAGFFRSESDHHIIQTMGVLQGWPLQGGNDSNQQQYGDALKAIFLNSALNGGIAGAEASELEDTWRRGCKLHLGLSMGAEAAWLLATGVGWGIRGDYPDPQALARGQRGAFDSPSGNAFRLMFPRQVATDALALLGYSGVLGKNGSPWFHVSNSLMTLMGLSLVMFARPISGNGSSPDSSIPGRPQSLLPNSLIGDYGGTFEGAKNFFLFANNFYDSKQNEVIVTELGFTLMSYAVNRWLRKSPALVLAPTESKDQTSIAKKSASARPQVNVSLSGGPGGATLQVGGSF